MRSLELLVGLYPVFLGLQVGLDKLTRWSIADWFGKTPPGRREVE